MGGDAFLVLFYRNFPADPLHRGDGQLPRGLNGAIQADRAGLAAAAAGPLAGLYQEVARPQLRLQQPQVLVDHGAAVGEAVPGAPLITL